MLDSTGTLQPTPIPDPLSASIQVVVEDQSTCRFCFLKLESIMQAHAARHTDLFTLQQQRAADALIWRSLPPHVHIVPLLAIPTNPDICFVTPWMPGGNISKYIEDHPNCDRLLLLAGVARGITFLHEIDIIHGDVKDTNVLVNSGGIACLTDLLTARRANAPIPLRFQQVWGTMRWNAPELLVPELYGRNAANNCPSKESDVYAFGLLAWQIFSGIVPFSNIRSDANAVLRIVQGDRPSRTQQCNEAGLTNELWDLIERCWVANDHLRPTMSEVARELEGLRAVAPDNKTHG
ncbi:kinase-like protein [Heliocybe sulcata]|uniref:Kinase-like protein n=1 Tax=Heliocybe sulcata TaxID=5364 RepID=A0A5C3N9R5_9AGAM|nr:kinase-like protein [Heliocybe sulcata]